MDMGRLDHSLKNLFYELMFYREKLIKQEGLPITAFFIIIFIEKQGPKKPSELSIRLGISKSSVTQLVDLLIGKGLIERKYDQSDRRTIYIALSRKGSDLVKRMFLLEAISEEYLKGISDESVQLLGDLFEKLAVSVHEKRMELDQ